MKLQIRKKRQSPLQDSPKPNTSQGARSPVPFHQCACNNYWKSVRKPNTTAISPMGCHLLHHFLAFSRLDFSFLHELSVETRPIAHIFASWSVKSCLEPKRWPLFGFCPKADWKHCKNTCFTVRFTVWILIVCCFVVQLVEVLNNPRWSYCINESSSLRNSGFGSSVPSRLAVFTLKWVLLQSELP